MEAERAAEITQRLLTSIADFAASKHAESGLAAHLAAELAQGIGARAWGLYLAELSPGGVPGMAARRGDWGEYDQANLAALAEASLQAGQPGWHSESEQLVLLPDPEVEFDIAAPLLSLPFSVPGRTLGAQLLRFEPALLANAEGIRGLQRLAGIVGLALSRQIASEAELRRAEELEALRIASLGLTAKLEPKEVLRAILENTLALIEAGDAHIFLYDGAQLSFAAARWAGEDRGDPFSEPRRSGLTYTVARSGERLAIPDTRGHPMFADMDWEGAIIGLPLLAEQRVVGVMNVAFDHPHNFDTNELRILELLADQAAVALVNAERYRQVRRRLTELTAIQQVANVVNRNLEIKPLLVEAVHQVREALGYPVVEVYLVEEDELVQRSALELQGVDSLRLPFSRGVIGRVVRTNEPALVPDVSQDPDYVQGLPNSVAEIAVPLRKGDLVIGVLNVETADPEGLGEHDLRVLTLLADQLSVAIENAALYERLRLSRDELEARVEQRTAELAEALDQASQASRVKTQFVSDVSHELRTPLSNIRLYLDLMEHGKQERWPQYLETLKRETDRLVVLIEDLLTISQMDARTSPIEMYPLDVNALVEPLIVDRRKLFAERGLQLAFRAEEDLPPVMGDAQLLSKALAHLLTNALQYTQQGGDVLVSTQTYKEDEQSWVQLSVSDSGPGIAQEERAQLFERFFRGAVGRQARTPGTGLGLAIVKEVVDRHTGKITVESEPAAGSRFVLWLPIRNHTSPKAA